MHNKIEQPPISQSTVASLFNQRGWRSQVATMLAYFDIEKDPDLLMEITEILREAHNHETRTAGALPSADFLKAVRFWVTVERLFQLRAFARGQQHPEGVEGISWDDVWRGTHKMEVRFLTGYAMAYSEEGLIKTFGLILDQSINGKIDFEDDRRAKYRQLMDGLLAAIIAFMCMFRDTIIAYEHPALWDDDTKRAEADDDEEDE